MINRNRVRLSKLSIGLALALAAAPAFAQNTSSAVGGRITDANGQPVTGAEVTILHTESGTSSTATTGADGRYISRGLRVGGPYTITVSKDGKVEKREGVYLALAETNNVDAILGAATNIGTVEVVGASVESVFSPNKMGAGTNVSREQIENLPSATRNIQDYIRLDPRISQVSKADGAISVGGQNTRYNSIKIDGVGASDPFGLEPNNLPTERQPVSTAALEAIKIAVADYDVTIAGGVGGVINAVTKSGTNDWKGSLYYSLRDGDWVRQELPTIGSSGGKFEGWKEEETYGFTLGGPIVQDKLFLFANYESYTKKEPGVGLGSTPYASGQITDADIARVQAAATAKGFDAGEFNVSNNDTTIEEYAVKLDWNISDAHRAALRYSKTEQNVVFFRNLNDRGISLSSHYQDLPKTFESTVLEVFSDWNESVSTELKLSTRDYAAERQNFSYLPHIRISGYSAAGRQIFIGTEQNSHINAIDTDQFSAFGALNWYAGDHVMKFGFEHEANDVFNFFGRNLNGYYEFRNIADFESGRIDRWAHRIAVPGGNVADDVPAEYGQRNTALFLQDTWSVSSNLTLTYGLRWDKPSYDEQPLRNTFVGGIYGFDNTVVPDTALLQPRFGFNYTFNSDRPTQLRGGIGLFQGASPNVWLAGIYQNTGLNYLEYDLTRGSNATVNAALDAMVFSADPNNQPVPVGINLAACYPTPPSGSAGALCARQGVDFVEPGFALPSAWKANLAFEHELPWYGIVLSAELLRTKVKDAIFIERLDLFNAAGHGSDFTSALDNRDLYWSGGTSASSGIALATGSQEYRPSGVGNVLKLRNTDKGESTQFTVGLNKPMIHDWSWSLAYTYTKATEVSPLSNSINFSTWSNTLITNVNEEVAKNSRYAIKDRITGTVNWQHVFFGDYKTSVGLFYEGRSGRPFSYIYSSDMNGDGVNFNDLFYVPAGPGDVEFTGGDAMEAAFFAWLDQNPELKRYAGQVAPANAFRTGFVHNFDVRISQELPGFVEGHNFEVSLDILNIGNLINKDWGLIQDYGFFSTAQVLRYAGVCQAVGTSPTAVCDSANDIGKYVYNFTTPPVPQIQENGEDKGNQGVSRWSAVLTLRYEF